MNKLGMGLSTLIPNKEDEIYKKGNERKVRLSFLYPSKFQTRKNFKDDKLQELSDSIKSNGVIQPIIIRKREKDKYEIIAGERRWRASKIAGLDEIPAIVVDVDDEKALEISIIENVQRDDLNVLEEAIGYQNLISNFNYLQDDISKIVGKSRSHISNCMRILSLSEEIKDLIRKDFLSMGHARALVGVENATEFAKHIIQKSLNVRQTESLVKKGKKKIKSVSSVDKEEKKSEDIIVLEKRLSTKLGLEVTIHDNKKDGFVAIKFKNLSELETILRKLNQN